ncbi:hypothetical protein GTA08_BOTSDO12381 [Botryosphaeria dothidea]|uniref:Uncharacterized protein n=1 Tax=Botryosphaeria dothidea TaxID=55169 RepID=A0A8H4N9A3_9PEZI|nr:hypothetical protein GTA08_BOTSDO12381 [Botryosphaeria dothidea]
MPPGLQGWQGSDDGLKYAPTISGISMAAENSGSATAAHSISALHGGGRPGRGLLPPGPARRGSRDLQQPGRLLSARAIGARAAQFSPLWLCMPTPAPARVTPLVSAISKQAAQLSASAAGAGAAPLLVLEPAPRPPALHSPACRCLSLPAARYPFAPPTRAPALRPSGSNAVCAPVPIGPDARVPLSLKLWLAPPKAPQRPSCARPSLDHAHHSPHALPPPPTDALNPPTTHLLHAHLPDAAGLLLAPERTLPPTHLPAHGSAA